jgi:ABC-type transport system involved in multi-copper enzyme maturation permease subunit
MVILLSVSFNEETGAVLQYSNPVLTFIFIFLYASNLIAFLFIISTFFNRPNLALSIAVIIHFLTFIIPNNIINRFNRVLFLIHNTSTNRPSNASVSYSFPTKLALGLLPNINLLWGMKVLLGAEARGTGLQWDSVFARDDPEDPLTMGVVW